MRLLPSIIATILLIGLSYLLLILLDKFLFENIQNLKYPDFNYKLIYSLIFGLFVGCSIILNRAIKLKGIVFLTALVVVGFIIGGLIILNVSKSLNSSTMTLNFKMIYYLPLFPFILLLFIRVLRLSKAFKLVLFIPKIGQNLKTNVARLYSFLIDILIVFLLGLFFYKTRIILWLPIELFLILFAYRFILESSISTTIGKMLFNIKVGKPDKNIPTIKDILVRNIARLTVFYWIPIINGKIGIHDRLAKTETIKNALKINI